MKKARPSAETDYINKRLAHVLRRLEKPAEQVAFLEFATKHGIDDPIAFATRLRNTLKGGRPPSAFTALLLADFGDSEKRN